MTTLQSTHYLYIVFEFFFVTSFDWYKIQYYTKELLTINWSIVEIRLLDHTYIFIKSDQTCSIDQDKPVFLNNRIDVNESAAIKIWMIIPLYNIPNHSSLIEYCDQLYTSSNCFFQFPFNLHFFDLSQLYFSDEMKLLTD